MQAVYKRGQPPKNICLISIKQIKLKTLYRLPVTKFKQNGCHIENYLHTHPPYLSTWIPIRSLLTCPSATLVDHFTQLWALTHVTESPALSLANNGHLEHPVPAILSWGENAWEFDQTANPMVAKSPFKAMVGGFVSLITCHCCHMQVSSKK